MEWEQPVRLTTSAATRVAAALGERTASRIRQRYFNSCVSGRVRRSNAGPASWGGTSSAYGLLRARCGGARTKACETLRDVFLQELCTATPTWLEATAVWHQARLAHQNNRRDV